MRAALYLRVSDPKQEEASSLRTQESAGPKHAQEHSYTLFEEHIYREIHTGVELWERRELTRLREAIRAHDIDVVIAYAIDRLARDPVHLGVIISEAEHHSVRIEFVSEPLDNSPEGQLIRFVRGYAAKVEHEKIRERSMRGTRARVERGLPTATGRRPRYGYQWRDSQKSGFEPDLLTAPIVQRIFKEAAKGVSLRSQATHLTAEGIPTPLGGTIWYATTIRQILIDPAYVGRPMAFRWIRGKGGNGTYFSHMRPIDEQIPLPAEVSPPLTDEETFQAANLRLKLNKPFSARHNQNPEATLLRAGFAICGVCGNSLAVHADRRLKDKRSYECSRRGMNGHNQHNVYVNAKVLDEAAWKKLSKVINDPTVIERELTRLLEEDPTPTDVAAVDRAIKQLERTRRNLVGNLGKLDPDSAAAVRAELQAVSTRLIGLESEREQLLERQQAWLLARERMANLQAAFERIPRKLGELTYEEKRVALEAYKVEAKVWPVGHEPRFEITCDPLASVQNGSR